MAKGAGGFIKGLIYLVLIGGAIAGAKMFWFDPMKVREALQQTRGDISAKITDGDYDAALKEADKLQTKYPDQKKFCDGRRFEIYRDWAESEYNKMLDNERKRSKYKNDPEKKILYAGKVKANANTCLSNLANAEKYGKLTKVEVQWQVICYGNLGDKAKVREAMKRQKELQ